MQFQQLVIKVFLKGCLNESTRNEWAEMGLNCYRKSSEKIMAEG